MHIFNICSYVVRTDVIIVVIFCCYCETVTVYDQGFVRVLKLQRKLHVLCAKAWCTMTLTGVKTRVFIFYRNIWDAIQSVLACCVRDEFVRRWISVDLGMHA